MKKLFRFLLMILPDKVSIQLRYFYNFHKFVNFNNPKTFTEKIQWLKLYNRKPEYTQLVDKYAAKEYVGNIIGKDYIIPTFGVWDNVDDIDFDKLPQQFVLKTTHAGGSNGVVICGDKRELNISETQQKLRNSLLIDSYAVSKEMPYKNVHRRVIAEKFLVVPNRLELTDYKIYCFNGTPKYIQVIQDRNTKETIDFFDTEWLHQPFVGLNPNCKNADEIPSKPENLKEMLEVAKKLSKNIPFVRIDLYNVEGKVYFGEITFYPASGMGRFTPDEFNRKLGDEIKIPLTKK